MEQPITPAPTIATSAVTGEEAGAAEEKEEDEVVVGREVYEEGIAAQAEQRKRNGAARSCRGASTSARWPR